jgi:dTDP-4-dehydrorhamnose reductase
MTIKVAILGSEGFLGKFLIKELSWHSEIVILPIHRGNLNLLDEGAVRLWLKHNTPDCIVNCATSGGNEQLSSLVSYIIRNNVNIVLNFYNNKEFFKKFINIGSGAEYDLSTDINNVSEHDVFGRFPKDSYGYSKNIISRFLHNSPNFYTLRLFGCFHHSERPFRLFSKFVKDQTIPITDTKFDYFYAHDFLLILLSYILSESEDLPSTMNCVYLEKLYLSEILKMFNLGAPNVVNVSRLNYTADGKIMDDYCNKRGIRLHGLQMGIKDYLLRV